MPTDGAKRIDAIELLRHLGGATEKEKADALLTLRRLRAARDATKSEHDVARVPQTPDELHAWILAETGYDIPRVAVCDDHRAPFDFIVDFFFERERAMLQIGSREMGKTLGVSIVHYANAKCKPGVESCTFGAIEPQAKKAYLHLTSFIYTRTPDGKRILDSDVDETLRSETRWRSGSKVEILVGSKSGVNSPHPQKVHADEVDLMEDDIWDESRNMASSKTVGGIRYRAQDVATSTRKSMKGLVQKIVKECEDALRRGFTPAWKIYISCVFEGAREVPECRAAPDDARRVRLIELGMDPCTLCACNTHVKGEWGEDRPRTLESVCKGKFFRSRGWMEHEDVVGKFMQNSQNVWDAQMECRRAEVDGLYLRNWSRQRFTTRGWVPRPDLGPIWQGIDWGGSAATFLVWFQGPLHNSVEVAGHDGQVVVVPRGAYVAFHEISLAGTGATRMADMTVNQEIQWRTTYPGFRVRGRFADVAGRQQRDDWREHSPPLRTQWHISRDKDGTIETLQDVSDDGLLWVDALGAPGLVDDYESWRQRDGREVHDDASHGPAASRYCLSNVRVLVRRQRRESASSSAQPVVLAGAASSIPGAGPVASGAIESERWRETLGHQITGHNEGVTGWQQ